jgi:hypothetical protein
MPVHMHVRQFLFELGGGLDNHLGFLKMLKSIMDDNGMKSRYLNILVDDMIKFKGKHSSLDGVYHQQMTYVSDKDSNLRRKGIYKIPKKKLKKNERDRDSEFYEFDDPFIEMIMSDVPIGELNLSHR